MENRKSAKTSLSGRLVFTIFMISIIATTNSMAFSSMPADNLNSQQLDSQKLQIQLNLQPQPHLTNLPNKYSNLDDFFSNLLDDGNRLKKSRLLLQRPAKHTLRFGKRSDPMVLERPSGELISLADYLNERTRFTQV